MTEEEFQNKKRLIGIHRVSREAKIYKDREWEEYTVQFFLNDKKIDGRDYETNSLDVALDTAESWMYP